MNKLLILLIFLTPMFASTSCKHQTSNHNQVSTNKMNITVLGIKECEATNKTITLVKSVAESMKIDIDLQTVTIETPEQAKKEQFVGSPSVRINGLDIDPVARNIKFYGVT